MSNVNRVELLGNLGCDVECRYLSSGTATSTFRLATNERWTNKNGEKCERTEWHRIVVWGRLAEACAEYLAKGRRVRVEGSLRTRDWTDRNGVKRYVTEISAKKVDFLDTRSSLNKPDDDQKKKDDFDSEVVSESLNEESIARAMADELF